MADYVKANWDASVDRKGRKVGIEIIIRDEEWEVLVAIGGQRNNIDQPVVAENHALWKARKAIEVCRDLRFDKVIFDGDAEVIINAVNNVKKIYHFMGVLHKAQSSF